MLGKEEKKGRGGYLREHGASRTQPSSATIRPGQESSHNLSQCYFTRFRAKNSTIMSYTSHLHALDVKTEQSRHQATNFTTPPAALILALPQPISRSTEALEITYSAFSDTYRAFTIIGKPGSLANPQSHTKRWFPAVRTNRPLPNTLLYPWCSTFTTGTTCESSLRSFLCSSGTRVHNLSTLIVGFHCVLRIKWKRRIPTLPK
jgi:hypothetical protein